MHFKSFRLALPNDVVMVSLSSHTPSTETYGTCFILVCLCCSFAAIKRDPNLMKFLCQNKFPTSGLPTSARDDKVAPDARDSPPPRPHPSPSQAWDEPFQARNGSVKYELGPLHHEMGPIGPGTAFPSLTKFIFL